MTSIFITGSSGFVGLNLIEYLRSFFIFIKYERETPIEINQDIVIHLAGKAHDLKKISNSDDYYIVNTELTKQLIDRKKSWRKLNPPKEERFVYFQCHQPTPLLILQFRLR